MPQAIGLLLVQTLTPLIGLSAAFSVAGTLISIGGNLLVSAALGALSRPGTPDAVRPENIQILNKSAAAPRSADFGVVKKAGNVVFERARDGISYRLVVHSHGEITNVLGHFLNNVPIALDDDYRVTDDQYLLSGGRLAAYYGSLLIGGAGDDSRVRIFSRKGLVPETHYSQITQVWPEWTSAHRLDGLWTSLIICEATPADKYRGMYPRNEPDLAVLAETTKCFDPRTGLTAFTENMALAINHYVASVDAFNRPSAFDLQDIATEADICDRDVALIAGGTEKLYRISGSYLLNEKPQDVLGRMLSACAGRIRLKPTGKLGLKVGAWTEPEFTLTFADILEVPEVTSGPDLLDRYNELPARFNSHDLGHIEVDAQPWLDEQRVAEDGEILVGEAKSMLMSPSHRQTRQVMKIDMDRDNPKQEVTLLCKPRALPAIYEDTIILNVPQLKLVGNFEVARHTVTFEKGLLKAVGLTLKKVDVAAFSLSLADQGAVQLLPEPDSPAGVPLPQNFTAAGSGIQTASNTFVAGIAAGWQAPPSDALSPVFKLTTTGGNNWQDVSVGSAATSITMPGLIDGQGYDLSLAFVTPGGVVGESVILTNIVAVAVSVAPEAPTNLVVSDAGGSVALVAMTASVSAALWKTEIYRDAVLVATLYAGPGSAIAFLDTCGSGTFDWSARSVNVSNINSATDVGPVTETIT
ncbi:hypothetical protein [uncultured Sulfitobacter sp.]|uniref:hypothetical protein n=1 Tax=uncultured Sulfitobacter sp. TaxID=191468 RepID=UPI00259302A6|nr:hypothetical protein [uncultured Sulfitobacter sp.]